jgi:hypothetical protein
VVLQIWFNEPPSKGVKLNEKTCQDFLKFVMSNHIVICTSRTGDQWTTLLDKWKSVFDKTLGVGKFEDARPRWMMPVIEPRPELGHHAIEFLKEEPDGLLRTILTSETRDFITNAQEFKREFAFITSNSKSVAIYDRYLLGCQQELFKLDDNRDIGYNDKFDEEDTFVGIIRGLDLILHSIDQKVEKLAIYSEMLSYPKFQQLVIHEQLNSNLDADIQIPKEWRKWHLNSEKARKNIAKQIIRRLNPSNKKLIIEFWDCSTDSRYSEMVHDRFIAYSQGHHISSGGFKNVHQSIHEVEDLEEIDLAPRTYLLKVILDDDNLAGSSLKMVGKKKL